MPKSWGGIEGLVNHARETASDPPSALTQRIATAAIYGQAYIVHVAALPLPAMPLTEMSSAGTAIEPDHYAHDEKNALAHARGLVQRGYRVRIVGGGKIMENDEVRRRLNG